MEKLQIERNLAQAILDYLKEKPYIEVAALIAELLKLGAEPSEPAEKEAESKD
jgi:hypothetical protein